MSADRLEDIKMQTAQDEQLYALKQIIWSDWPETRKQCHPLISEYWDHRDEITEAHRILLKGEKKIIPHKPRPHVLKKHSHRTFWNREKQTQSKRRDALTRHGSTDRRNSEKV